MKTKEKQGSVVRAEISSKYWKITFLFLEFAVDFQQVTVKMCWFHIRQAVTFSLT